MYIRANPNANGYYDMQNPIQEDDVLNLINTLMANTKSENIQNVSGDPFWEKAEQVYLQALFYYTLRHYDKAHQNFTAILNLIRSSSPDATGISKLDRLFNEWEQEEPDAIGVKQYKHLKVAQNAPKMMSTIIMTATARLTPFNIKEIENLTQVDTLELDRIGMPIDDDSPLLKEINKKSNKHIGNGKVAYFIVTKPSTSTYNFLASTFYSQVFEIIDENAKKCGGSLATPLEIYMDEWAQLRRNTTIC
jgi:type IV secretion system protein VirD4